MPSRTPSSVFAAALLAASLAILTTPAAAQTPPGRLAGLLDFTELYDKQAPAVVSVDVTQKVKRPRGLPDGLSEDDPFYDFFRRFQGPRRGGPSEREFDQ